MHPIVLSLLVPALLLHCGLLVANFISSDAPLLDDAF